MDVSAGNDSITWPLGVTAALHPESRHEVIRWDYFDENNLYLTDDFTNIEPIKGNLPQIINNPCQFTFIICVIIMCLYKVFASIIYSC